jgi:hypothetical protein
MRYSSLMDIHQSRTESPQEQMKAKTVVHQEKMKAAIFTIRPQLEETVKHRVENVLLRVDQMMQGLCKEPTEKIDETQVGLRTIRTSVNTQTRSLVETMTNTRGHLHKGFGLKIQDEAQMTKTLTDTLRRGLEDNIAEVKT